MHLECLSLESPFLHSSKVGLFVDVDGRQQTNKNEHDGGPLLCDINNNNTTSKIKQKKKKNSVDIDLDTVNK